MLVDGAEVDGKAHVQLCPVCDGPVELVDVVRQLWRKARRNNVVFT